MPTLEMEKTKTAAPFAADEWAEEDWLAHNNSAHIPNAETIEAMEDIRLRRNLHGPFATVEEAMRSMLED